MSQDELKTAFLAGHGRRIASIALERLQTGLAIGAAPAWLARIERT